MNQIEGRSVIYFWLSLLHHRLAKTIQTKAFSLYFFAFSFVGLSESENRQRFLTGQGT